jgi:hypothetical protein
MQPLLLDAARTRLLRANFTLMRKGADGRQDIHERSKLQLWSFGKLIRTPGQLNNLLTAAEQENQTLG